VCGKGMPPYRAFILLFGTARRGPAPVLFYLLPIASIATARDALSSGPLNYCPRPFPHPVRGRRFGGLPTNGFPRRRIRPLAASRTFRPRLALSTGSAAVHPR